MLLITPETEALAALPQLQPTVETSADGKALPSKVVSKLKRPVPTGQLANPRTRLANKSVNSKKRRALNNDDFWGYVSSDHEDVSAVGSLRPSKRRNTSQREASMSGDVRPVQPSTVCEQQPTGVGNQRMSSVNPAQSGRESMAVLIDLDEVDPPGKPAAVSALPKQDKDKRNRKSEHVDSDLEM